MSKQTKRYAVGALIAAVTGYVAGILTAPKSGKETREDVKKVANKALRESEKALKKVHSELKTLISKAEARLKKLSGKAQSQLKLKLDVAKNAKDKARQILTALHEGDSESADLKAALKEAKIARDHLKDFLKK